MIVAPHAGEDELLALLDPVLRLEIETLIARRVEEGARVATDLALRNLNLAQEGGRIGVFDINMSTGDATGSRMWAELLGLPDEARSISRRTWIKMLHPEDRDRILAMVAATVTSGADASMDYRIILPCGNVRWLHSRNLIASGTNGEQPTAYGTLQDVTDRKSLEEKVTHAAYHDDLTGLPNRRFFTEHLTAVCAAASPDKSVGLAIYDLDCLKQANDRHGHDAGDVLLKAAAECLKSVDDDGGIVARLGGDEFALVLQAGDPSRLRNVAGESLKALGRPIKFRGHRINSGASVGGAVSADRTISAATLFRRADQALLEAKRSGRGQYLEHVCSPSRTG